MGEAKKEITRELSITKYLTDLKLNIITESFVGLYSRFGLSFSYMTQAVGRPNILWLVYVIILSISLLSGEVM